MRRGRRVVAPHAVLHFLDRQRDSPSRFGFVVGKAVGGAVTRNLVRRRLRSLCRESLTVIGPGHDVVVRALPGSHEVPWATLHAEIVDAIDRGVKKR